MLTSFSLTFWVWPLLSLASPVSRWPNYFHRSGIDLVLHWVHWQEGDKNRNLVSMAHQNKLSVRQLCGYYLVAMTRQRSLQGNTDEGKEMQLSNAKGRDVRETSKLPLGAQNRFLPSACQTFLLSLLACPSEISIIWFLLIYLFFFIPALQAGELCLQLLDKLPVLLPPAPVVLPHSIIQLSRHETMIRRQCLQPSYKLNRTGFMILRAI